MKKCRSKVLSGEKFGPKSYNEICWCYCQLYQVGAHMMYNVNSVGDEHASPDWKESSREFNPLEFGIRCRVRRRWRGSTGDSPHWNPVFGLGFSSLYPEQSGISRNHPNPKIIQNIRKLAEFTFFYCQLISDDVCWQSARRSVHTADYKICTKFDL